MLDIDFHGDEQRRIRLDRSIEGDGSELATTSLIHLMHICGTKAALSLNHDYYDVDHAAIPPVLIAKRGRDPSGKSEGQWWRCVSTIRRRVQSVRGELKLFW